MLTGEKYEVLPTKKNTGFHMMNKAIVESNKGRKAVIKSGKLKHSQRHLGQIHPSLMPIEQEGVFFQFVQVRACYGYF